MTTGSQKVFLCVAHRELLESRCIYPFFLPVVYKMLLRWKLGNGILTCSELSRANAMIWIYTIATSCQADQFLVISRGGQQLRYCIVDINRCASYVTVMSRKVHEHVTVLWLALA
jgi:hypothetical protein